MPGIYPEFKWALVPILILEAVLKGFALWKAARREDKYWFIALLIFNTAGILPVVYMLFFADRARKESTPPAKPVSRRKSRKS